MKKGDYIIHVYIEEGRGFIPESEGDTVDPIIIVTGFGKEKATSIKQDVGGAAVVYWGEHLFFERKNLDHSQIALERLLIEAKDHRAILKDNRIGLYEFDLATIYGENQHTLKHIWIALFNPDSENFEVVKGYLKVSISVLHETDKPIDLTVKDASTIGEEELKIPAQLKPKLSQLVVTLLDANSLVKMDTHGTIDAYAEVNFGSAKCRSCTITADAATMSVAWYQRLYIPVMTPSVSS